MATFHDSQSFLKGAGVNKFYLDINQLPKLGKSPADQLYVIESKFANRPDLLSNKLYGTTKLWWVFALRNPDLLVDPLEDFTSGKEIYIPSTKAIDRLR
jgi:hypothetical protein|tara:strand:+ start:8190 stop:8486 length:297 start_codon:yes stop_codon:yes gene_type:complete